MSLYKEIKSHFTLPDAFTDWNNYRNTLTSYLLAQTDRITLPLSFHADMEQSEMLPTLAIIGAGACNDLDLARLSSHFSKITLMDYDETAIKTALSTYCLENSSAIELCPASLNGITDSDYRHFCEELQTYVRLNQRSLSSKGFERFALFQLEVLYKKSRQAAIPLAPAAYDYIWCFGVHSQLQAMFSYIYHAFKVNLETTLLQESVLLSDSFSYRLKRENDYFIPRFHDSLLASAKKAVFLGLEQKRLENDEAIEGAYQAINDIRNRNLQITESGILWPFYPARNISYEMLVQKIVL